MKIANNHFELVAPAGNMERLKTAVYFGADAAYFAGKNFGLRAFSDNFTDTELTEAINYLHKNNRKAYITVNIFARTPDFAAIEPHLAIIADAGADGVIVSDLGLLNYIKSKFPTLKIHISTQANVTNKYSAMEYVKLGTERLILARELTLSEIREIRDYLPANVVLEAFCHGAMCISYSGRCLLSNYLCGRDSNRGECVQACRWEYKISESSRDPENALTLQEDARGSYIFNSKDLNMLAHLDKMADAGISSFKIEGRMKTAYYVANTVNAYRRALDLLQKGGAYRPDKALLDELYKSSHRRYTTGFYLGEGGAEDIKSSAVTQEAKFTAVVLHAEFGKALIEMRNRFQHGDTLEVLSPDENFNKKIKIISMSSENGAAVQIADKVQERLYVDTGDITLHTGDILRK